MAQLERSVLATPAIDRQATRFGRVPFVKIGGIALVGALLGAALIISQGSGGQGPQAGTRTDAVDGWMPAITEANRAAGEAAMLEEAGRAQDGWASGLLKPASQVTDGWAARYLLSDDD